MTRITQLLDAGPTLSFEFSAPRDEPGAERLRRSLSALSALRPQFMSVTYGAGGGTRGPTREWVRTIREDYGIEAMPHLTCVAHTREEVAAIIDEYRDDGVDNILALRGDLPQDSAHLRSTQAFDTAVELAAFIRARAKWDIGVAAHPEGHPMASSPEADLAHQSAKLSSADFALTQFFFDAGHYERFVDALASRGVDTPVIPGLMPPTNLASVERMSMLNATEFPDSIRSRLERAADASERRAIGVEVASELGRALLELGAPGLHIYTMNFSRAASEVAEALFPASASESASELLR